MSLGLRRTVKASPGTCPYSLCFRAGAQQGLVPGVQLLWQVLQKPVPSFKAGDQQGFNCRCCLCQNLSLGFGGEVQQELVQGLRLLYVEGAPLAHAGSAVVS